MFPLPHRDSTRTDSRPCAVYLRKSRKDAEAEALGETDTLRRHRTRLLALADQQCLTVAQIYEEVVSGDSIAARPEMQKLLSAVERGAFSGVLVMEVERLARGDTIDQGIVAQTFKYSGTKIITPVKTYDPENEFDEEYFEFGLFMSRREYKAINRRLQRGRDASMREGKFVGNKTPFGYSRRKLEHEKGFVLEPVSEQAGIVRHIFNWYTGGDGAPRLGISLIVRRLNELHIPSPSGRDWTNSAVRGILANPTYCGWLRWGNRATVKRVVDGEVVPSRPLAPAAEVRLYRGLHKPIVPQELFDRAQRLLSSNPSRPGPKQAAMANPLCGLVFCEQCGRAMVRRPYTSGREPCLMCACSSCATVSSDLAVVEALILAALREWTGKFDLGEARFPTYDGSAALLRSSLETLEAGLASLKSREAKAYELVEAGVYTPEVFRRRLSSISAERSALTAKLDAQREQLGSLFEGECPRAELVPTIRHVLDAYPAASGAEEKNRLLRAVVCKAIYHKTRRDRSPGGGDLSLTLYPVIPPSL